MFKKSLIAAMCVFISACGPLPQKYASINDHPQADNSAIFAVNYSHQDREPCEGYERDIGYMAYIPSCIHVDVASITPAAGEPAVAAPVVHDYTVHFDLDRAVVRASEATTLDEAARDIKSYNPTEIIIAGYADTSGPAEYNERLSQRRADAIAEALRQRGIDKPMTREAHGERDLAVATEDGTRLEENRRVVVHYYSQP